ncbi:MAG: hypothetical protein ACJ0J2_07680 [Dehalococcoidia bacterium]
MISVVISLMILMHLKMPRAMNEATAFANKSFEVQGAYNEALGIERDIFVAPPMMGPMGPNAGPMAGTGPAGTGPMAPGGFGPMTGPRTGPMTAPMAAPMPMDTLWVC